MNIRIRLLHVHFSLCLFTCLNYGNAFHSIYPKSLKRTKKEIRISIALQSNSDLNDNDIIASMESQGLSKRNQEVVMSHLTRSGLWTEDESSDTLILLAKDFVERPEVFSSLLINDFGFPPLAAHQTRALAMAVIKEKNTLTHDVKDAKEAKESTVDLEPWTITKENTTNESRKQEVSEKKAKTKDNKRITKPIEENNNEAETESEIKSKEKRKNFKSIIVNEKAKARRKSGDYEYALNEGEFPHLAKDLEEFYSFMTRPSPHSQEDPIRSATADVYMRHARQFLGWYVKEKHAIASSSKDPVSLFQIIKDKEKESANDIIDFVLWLRSRNVSVSYEANILRGLTKLLKFRFSRESRSDPSNGGNTFDDIPMIKEIRKLHRDANKRQRLAPRSSNEQRKWLSWPEYLNVIKAMKQELLELIQNFYDPQSAQRKETVAEKYQCYLILALFASIPDRQRTMRELAIGSTLVKSEETDLWTVKHGPDDYKTGKSYGERPTIELRPELSEAIDDYINNWRSVLQPSTDYLFVQSRTGKPLTGDGIFQRVSRCCFKYGGKRTVSISCIFVTNWYPFCTISCSHCMA